MTTSPVSATFTGGHQFDAAIAAWVERAGEAAKVALAAAGASVAQESRLSFGTAGGPRQGATGRLEASVVSGPVKQHSLGYEMQVGPQGLAYVRRVELGKKGKRSAPPYPFFRPGYDRAAPTFVATFARVWADTRPRGR